MKPQPVAIGVHLGLMATMLVWALNVSLVKWLTGIMDVMLVASLRMVCASLVLVLLLFLSRQHLPRWRGRTLVLACVSALLMVYGNQILFAGAMEKTTASNAALILALNPLLNGLLEALAFRKRLTAPYVLGALLAVAGVLLVILNRPHLNLAGPSLGDVLVFGSMLSFSTGVLILQRLARDNTAQEINSFLYLIGTLALVLHAAVTLREPLAAVQALSWQGWAGVVFSGVVATAAGALAWTRGVAAMGLGRAAVYMSWVPVLGVAFGALLLGEQLTIWHLFGMILVLSGTVLSSQRFRLLTPVPEK
ncbi:DMT family transporter [Noviherbaspirillum sedimenti]|uniref:DMT family transporter n=1 Tax=Noviherbaspirillum sedimenti TaxID=2320865 RepID=A0A3A3G9F4_9BURK|nr:DMT family transporter [Noviherbaspirillum sedimenti]RJG03379.1 DMT family transporter [Noviherbaspirillum sedimenti]